MSYAPKIRLTPEDEALIAREEANGHSIYGGSKAHRFGPCTGSLRAEMGFPDTARYEAAEGTVFHSLMEDWLTNGRHPKERIGEIVRTKLHTGVYMIPVDAEMVSYAKACHRYVFEAEGDHYFEQRVDYSRLTPIPRQGGSADHLCVRYGHMTGTDFKYGVADRIYAYQNPQVSLYLLGGIFEWDWLYNIRTVKIRIAQPRLDHWDEWDTTVEELEDFAQWISGRMHEGWRLDAPRTPGEKQCRYCKLGASNRCAEKNAETDKLLDLIFDDETYSENVPKGTIPSLFDESHAISFGRAPNFKELPTSVLVNVLKHQKLIEKTFEHVRDELNDRMLRRGERPDGWMVAEGKIRRFVSNPTGVLKILRRIGLDEDAAYEPSTMLSPAKLEKVMVKKGVPLSRAKALLGPSIKEVPGQPVVSMTKLGKRAAIDIAEASFVDERLPADRYDEGL